MYYYAMLLYINYCRCYDVGGTREASGLSTGWGVCVYLYLLYLP